MRRWLILTATTAAVLLLGAVAALSFLARSACRAATENGTIRDFHQFTAEQLEREVRSRVPPGSSRAFVERFLTGKGMQFNYDSSSSAIFAKAPCLKGSNIVIESLGFTFRFDSNSKLKSIESKVHLTGP